MDLAAYCEVHNLLCQTALVFLEEPKNQINHRLVISAYLKFQFSLFYSYRLKLRNQNTLEGIFHLN